MPEIITCDWVPVCRLLPKPQGAAGRIASIFKHETNIMLNRENSHFQLSSQFHSGNDTLRGLTRSQTRGGPSRLALRATASRGCGLDRPPPLRPGGLHALRQALSTKAAAIAAIIFARSPNGSKSIRKNCASWDRKACSRARSSPMKAQKRQVLACPVLYRSGAPDTIRTCDLCLRRATLYPAELRVHRGLI